MKLTDVLRKECVAAGGQPNSKTEVLREIARIARKSDILQGVGEDEIFEGLQRREDLGSTGFGDGIAIPHCRLESVSDFVVGMMTIPQGVAFDALDQQDVTLIFFIIAPAVQSDAHVKLLSAISQTLMAKGIRQELLAQKSSEGLYESFLRHTVTDINGQQQQDRSLVHVFVQDESTFKDILQLLTSIESSSVVVLDAENSGAYLAKLPLFAGFWTDEPRQFCRIIMAIVEQGLINETIRRIETITGSLNQCRDVLLTVQPVSYWAGALGA